MPIKPQKEKILEAKQAYLILINNPKYSDDLFRYSVYLQEPKSESMQVLWPDDSHLDKPELLPLQVYTKRKELPAFHFALSGGGYSKPFELAQMLRKINPKLTVYSLNGHMPCREGNY